MSYVMYTNILAEIMKKQQFLSLSNLYGNAYASESAQEVISSANPFKELIGNTEGGSTGGMQRITRSALQELGKINRV